MAKWGEGDERWRVNDLGVQGRNVNNWHWVEKDAMEWSRSRLNALLGDVVLCSDGATDVRTAGLSKLDGEAIVNNRKNKVIAAYELDVRFDWKGTVDGEAVSGQIRLPYVSEENHDEDPEVQVTTAADSPPSRKAKEAILSHGKKVLHDAVAVFVRELRAGGPMQPGGSAGVAQQAEQLPKQAQQDNRGGVDVPAPAPQQPAPAAGGAKGGGGQQIKLTERFFASAADIYECFTDPRRIMAYTQSPAEVQAEAGGKLSMFGGSIQGEFREVSPPHRLVLGWRFSNWEEGCWSQVSISIEEKDKGNTKVTLTQSGIPETDRFGNHDVLSSVEAGWKQQVFHRIRAVFGYGL